MTRDDQTLHTIRGVPEGEFPPPVHRWETKPGDRFMPFATRAWMNEDGYGFRYFVLEQPSTLARAIKRGFEQEGSDDFSIAVIRDGAMVARLWMEEIVDEDPSDLAEIAAALGLGA